MSLFLRSRRNSSMPPSGFPSASASKNLRSTLFRRKTLHDDAVQQGFAFDNVNCRLFVAQRRNGAAASSGNLCITQLDFSGKQVGYMHLTGFGHGVSFGAQAEGLATYLWVEVDPNKGGTGGTARDWHGSNSPAERRWRTRQPRWRSLPPSRPRRSTHARSTR